MGDCRLLFRLDASLCDLENKTSSDGNDGKQTLNFSKLFSADTTVREVFDETTLRDAKEKRLKEECSSVSLRSLMRGAHKARLWDCTRHPPRDISDWPLHTYSAIKGSKSKTLYDAGWFPSGTLSLLPPGQTPKASSLELDIQFNLQRNEGETEKTDDSFVKQEDRPKPSEVVQLAKSRFDEDDSTISTQQTISTATVETSKTQRMLRQRRETNRKRHLEDCLKKLDHNKGHTKNSNVSSQVRKMLIKSRATGRADLAVPDRVYLHCVFLDETANNTDEEDMEPRQEFRYFSRQDTVGRVLDSFPVPKGKQTEFLIQVNGYGEGGDNNDEDSSEYAKLPSLMRLYEAIDNGYLSEADNKVVLRIYNPVRHNPTVVVDRQNCRNPTEKIDPVEDPPPKSAADPPESSSAVHNVATGPHPSSDGQTNPPSDIDNTDLTPPGKDPPDIVKETARTHEPVPKPESSKQQDMDLTPASSSDTAESSRTSASTSTAKSDPSGSKLQNHVDLELSRNTPTVVSPRLVQAIREAEQTGGAKKKTKAKASAAARKVRQMQIKAKAVGDDKRVRATARLHFEIIVVKLDPASNRFDVERITPHFLATTDMLSRIVRDYYASYSFHDDHGNEHVVERWDYLVLPAEASTENNDTVALQRILDPSQKLKDLQTRSLLQPFDKVVLMPILECESK